MKEVEVTMSRVAQLLALAGMMVLALGAAPKPVKQPPRTAFPVQTAAGQITKVDLAAGQITLAVRTFAPGAPKAGSQTFAISKSTPVSQGMMVKPKDLRKGDTVSVNYSAPMDVGRRSWFGTYPHVSVFGSVTKTSPLTVKVTNGVDLVVSSSAQVGIQREKKLSAKDLKQGWLVSVVSRKSGGRAIADQVRVMSTFTMPAIATPKPKSKP